MDAEPPLELLDDCLLRIVRPRKQMKRDLLGIAVIRRWRTGGEEQERSNDGNAS